MAKKKRNTRRSEFGSVRQLPSGRWQARYRENGVDKATTPGVTYETKQEAKDANEDFAYERRKGIRQADKPAEVPLADFARQWHAVHTAKSPANTRTDYHNVIRNGITRPGTPFTEVTVSAVTPMLVREWLNALPTPWVDEKGREHPGYGVASRVKAFRILSMIMKAAKREGLRADNPCDDMEPVPRGAKKQATRPHYYLYVAELARLIAAADYIPQRRHEDWGLFFEIGAWSGMRPQEIRALWPIQVMEDSILVDAAISDGSKKVDTERGSTKAGSHRWVHLPRPVLDRLHKRIADRGLAATDLIFPGEDGTFMWSSTYNGQGWKPMLGVAGVGPDLGSRLGCRHQAAIPYDLRAALITHLCSAGVPQVDIGAQVGHQDQATTDLYTTVVRAKAEDPIAVAARKETDRTRAGVIDFLYAEAQKTLGP